MKINWSVVILVVLGLMAAISASLLTASLRMEPKQLAAIATDKTRILVATREMGATTIVDSNAVVQKEVPKTEVPEGALSDPAQAVGKMLAVPVIEGQALTRAVFPAEGSGSQLAGTLPSGMRAVSVSLSDQGAMEGLVYPGCKVDVLGTFKIDPSNNTCGGDAVTTTLLENIEVVAVEHQTVGSANNEPDKDEANKRKQYSRGPLVTLRVDAKQAEAIQLAMQHGTISLAMRNPKDDQPGHADGTVLSGGRLAQLAQFLKPNVPDTTPKPAEPPPPPPPRQAEKPSAPEYTVDVIRGVDVETLSFSHSASPRVRVAQTNASRVSAPAVSAPKLQQAEGAK